MVYSLWFLGTNHALSTHRSAGLHPGENIITLEYPVKIVSAVLASDLVDEALPSRIVLASKASTGQIISQPLLTLMPNIVRPSAFSVSS